VVLAAGSASRMGRPKATLMWRGRPLLEHVFAVADASQLDGGVVVLGHAASQIRAAVVLPEGFRLALNPEHASGQASSLQRGLGALDDAAGAAVVLLGDQPTLSAEAIDAVVGEWRGGAGPVVRARYRDGPGHPVLFDRSVWPRLAELAGDTGARPLLEAHPELLVETSLDADAPPDVDTWADYRALTGR
jgi:CTP:molybdopterin cytidylyltransferase MocA